MQFGNTSNDVASLDIDLSTGLASSLVAAGNQVTVEVSYDGEYATIGEFVVDSVSVNNDRDEEKVKGRD